MGFIIDRLAAYLHNIRILMINLVMNELKTKLDKLLKKEEEEEERLKTIAY